MTKKNWYIVEVYLPMKKRGRVTGEWKQVAYVRGRDGVRKARAMVEPLETRKKKAPPASREQWPDVTKFNQDKAPIYAELRPDEVPRHLNAAMVEMLWLTKRQDPRWKSWGGTFPAVVITINDDFPAILDKHPELRDDFFKIQAERLYHYLSRGLPVETMQKLKELINNET